MERKRHPGLLASGRRSRISLRSIRATVGTRLLDEHLVAPAADLGHRCDDQQNYCRAEQDRGYRPREEYRGVAAGNQHRPPKVLLHERPEHETEQQWGGLEVVLDQPKADHT